ncbi:TetR/AcrR family transcriptional regulator [Nonomuraea sp. NPDC050556]|uniref:TetR/AcrR family transcriptional regulator n=1 Tax=Nonomuraea sp. NPDC050556 TaxID=3364369 RepID=UPI0037A8D532
MVRRTQAERSGATSATLVEVARLLFARDGYAGTSIDAVAAAAGMTKGAAYHHFDGKAALFRAVFEQEQSQVAAVLEEAAGRAPNPMDALAAGARAFLERCLDPGFRQIVLLDGPSVLGWQGVRALQADHTLRVLRDGLTAATGDDSEVLAHLIFGALCEAGLFLASTDHPADALPAVLTEAEHLLRTLGG